MDAIKHIYNVYMLSLIAKLVFGYDCQIVIPIDDDSFCLSYPKDNDKI